MLEIKNITKVFDKTKGIKDFSLNVEPGKIYGIVGDNGAGKSTLFKTVFCEYKKDAGEVIIDGESLYENRNLVKISYFPDQSIYPQNISLFEFAQHDGKLCGMSKSEINTRFDFLLAKFDLTDYKNKTFAVLSAGMQKRALLAIILLTSPKYIFLDEPTANLDVNSRLEFHNILKVLSKENHVGIIISSHIINELENFIDHLVIIEKAVVKYNHSFDNKKEKIETYYFSETKKTIKEYEDLY